MTEKTKTMKNFTNEECRKATMSRKRHNFKNDRKMIHMKKPQKMVESKILEENYDIK